MINNQIFLLQETGEELLKDGKVPAALACFKEARSILNELRRDSLPVFAQFCIYAKLNPSYTLYAEFCARNNMHALNEFDYDAVIPQETPKSLL